MQITKERLMALLDYNPDTGVFVWRTSIGRSPAGSVAGHIRHDGYIIIGIDGRNYYAHRLVGLLYDFDCSNGLDHINCNKGDNRIINLRGATQSQNMANMHVVHSGLKGAYLDARTGRWYAKICKQYKQRFLGVFDTEEAAHAAYRDAAMDVHGEFLRAV